MEEIVLSYEEADILDRCKCYPYDGEKVTSPVVVWIIASIIMLSLMSGIVYLMAVDRVENARLLLFTVMAIVFGYIIKVMQFDAMRALTQYFVDEKGIYYKIRFTKISTKLVRVKRAYSLIPSVGEVKTLINAYKAERYKEELPEDFII